MPTKIEIDFDKIYNSYTGDYKIIEELNKDKYGRRRAKIRYINTGTEKIVYALDAINGRVKDNYAKAIYDVACIGGAKIDNKMNKRIYHIWYNTVCKCYNSISKEYKSFGANGFRVSEEWLCFENFLNDVKSLEGYDDYINNTDKSYRLGIYDNLLHTKLFSKETCYFKYARKS